MVMLQTCQFKIEVGTYMCLYIIIYLFQNRGTTSFHYTLGMKMNILY